MTLKKAVKIDVKCGYCKGDRAFNIKNDNTTGFIQKVFQLQLCILNILKKIKNNIIFFSVGRQSKS